VKPEDCDWLEKVGRKRWRTTRRLVYHYLGFDIEIPAGFEFDLFSGVGNTKHEEMWRAAALHDWTRQRPECSRRFADALFLLDMVRAAIAVYRRLLTVGGASQKRAQKELRSLLRRAAYYYIGVSGVVGSAYIGLGRAKAWIRKVF